MGPDDGAAGTTPRGPVPGRRLRCPVLWGAAVALAAMLAAACGSTARPLRMSVSAAGGRTASSPAPAVPGAPWTSVPPQRQPMLPGRYLPLWPFTDQAEVRAWQQSYRSGGHAPWHLDADVTAMSFVQGYLGFSELNTVVGRAIGDGEARISVGYRNAGDGHPSVAAVVHLLRAGSGADAPWEVVGTDDTTFTLTAPAYGAEVTSPLTVGGRITGVHERVRIEVRQPSSASPLGQYCCVTVSGHDAAWSARVSFRDAGKPVLTIVASAGRNPAGGNATSVERFTVTGVRL